CYSDNREWMAINFIGCSRHRRIGAILRPPDSETHYGNWWCALLVISIGEDPAAPGRNAKSCKEIPGDIFAIAGFNRRGGTCAPHRQISVRFAKLERGKVLECGSVCA